MVICPLPSFLASSSLSSSSSESSVASSPSLPRNASSGTLSDSETSSHSTHSTHTGPNNGHSANKGFLADLDPVERRGLLGMHEQFCRATRESHHREQLLSRDHSAAVSAAHTYTYTYTPPVLPHTQVHTQTHTQTHTLTGGAKQRKKRTHAESSGGGVGEVQHQTAAGLYSGRSCVVALREPLALRASVYEKYLRLSAHWYNAHDTQSMAERLLLRCAARDVRRSFNIWAPVPRTHTTHAPHTQTETHKPWDLTQSSLYVSPHTPHLAHLQTHPQTDTFMHTNAEGESASLSLCRSVSFAGLPLVLAGCERVFTALPDCLVLFDEDGTRTRVSEDGDKTLVSAAYTFFCTLSMMLPVETKEEKEEINVKKEESEENKDGEDKVEVSSAQSPFAKENAVFMGDAATEIAQKRKSCIFSLLTPSASPSVSLSPSPRSANNASPITALAALPKLSLQQVRVEMEGLHEVLFDADNHIVSSTDHCVRVKVSHPAVTAADLFLRMGY